MVNRPKVSAVIGSFNRFAFLKGIVESVREEALDVPIEIIVVDGGSTDGSLEWLLLQKDIITIIQHNRGTWRGKPITRRSWAYFTNLAFKCAEGKYILMLSDDCLIIPGAIKKGVDYFEARLAAGEKVGGVAFYWRDWPDEKDYRVSQVMNQRTIINHGLFLRDAVQEVGWLEEDLFDFYHADSDLALKLWHQGYAILEAPDSYVEHHGHVNEKIRFENSLNAKEDADKLVARWKDHFYDPSIKKIFHHKHRAYQDTTNTASKFKLFEAEADNFLTGPSASSGLVAKSSNFLAVRADEVSDDELTQLRTSFQKWLDLRNHHYIYSETHPLLSRIPIIGSLYRLIWRVMMLGKSWHLQEAFYRSVISELLEQRNQLMALKTEISADSQTREKL